MHVHVSSLNKQFALMHIIYTYLHFFLSKTFIIHFKILISFPYKCTEKKNKKYWIEEL